MKKTLISIGIGAGLMYLFDPELGEIRRSLLKDKFAGTMPQTKDAISHKKEEVVAKAGALAEHADAAAAEAIDSLNVDSIGEADGGDSSGSDGKSGHNDSA